MNMIKKFAMGASALALTFGLVACGDDNGGSIGDLTTTYTDGNKKVSVDGEIQATSKIFDVSYTLVDAKGATITGAIFAYALKDAFADFSGTTDSLLVNIGAKTADAPGLDLVVDFTKIDSAHCGELTLTVTAMVESESMVGAGDSVGVSSEVALNMPCNLTSTKDTVKTPNFTDIIVDSLETLTATLGGAKSTLGSSYDLDAAAMAAYTSAQLKATPALVNAIDVIFNGSKIMTPIGTSDVGYMSTTYSASTSNAFIIPVANTVTASKLADLTDLLDDADPVFSANLTATSAYLVVTSEGMPVLVKVKSLTAATQVVEITYSHKAAATAK